MTGSRITGPSRRQFLGGSALVSAGAIAGLAPGAAQARSAQTWDEEYDIVVVGSGGAASSAAMTARVAGASVMMLEKLPIAGGTTGKSGGVAWIPNNRFLREQGIDDAKADAMRYMVRFSYLTRYDPDHQTLGVSEREYRLIEAFYDNAAKATESLEATGAITFKQFRLYSVDRPAPDYASHFPENKVPTGRPIEPAVGSGGAVGGNSLAARLHEWLVANGVEIRLDSPVTRIVRSASRVDGVVVGEGEAARHVRARKGVIFGTGGYVHNPQMIDLHQKALYGSCASPGATGDLVPMAQEVGAQMGNLGTAWRSQVLLEDALKSRFLPRCADFLPGDSMIVVNKYGKRVLNEKRDYNDRGEVHFTYDPGREEFTNQVLFMIFDERSIDSAAGLYPFPSGKRLPTSIMQAADLPSLARLIEERLAAIASKTGGVSLDPSFEANMIGEVARFNSYAEKGVDPEFLRGQHAYDREWHLLFSARNPATRFPPNPYPNITMHPLASEGPFYAIMLAAGALDTSGGPMIDHNGQMLDPRGAPIAGLYGAGNCVASPSREAYYGAGATIGLGITFGHIAANHALEN